MPRRRVNPHEPEGKPIDQYQHKDKTRCNNPPVGLVTPDTDRETEKKKYQYDPNLDPQLIWAGKAEHPTIEIPTVSLHVHERIDPRSIIETVQKKQKSNQTQLSLFSSYGENPPIREAIEFYRHKHNWSNRIIAGDSLLVMNSLLEKEGMAGKVQMIYLDPPYGIKYGSNFQPFINKRDVKDGKDEDLTQEPETIRAFRDTWELGIHSYLTYLRDRLKLAKDLLTDSGSVFVQISDENLHYIREIMDEIFGKENFVSLITFKKKNMPLGSKLLEQMFDYIIWYGKNKGKLKYHKIFSKMNIEGDSHWNFIELPNGTIRKLTPEEINNHSLLPQNSEIFRFGALYSAGVNDSGFYNVEVEGENYPYPPGKGWKTPLDSMERLIEKKRVIPWEKGKTLGYKIKLSDFPVTPIDTVWTDTALLSNKIYAVQTSLIPIQKCMLMTTDPGDLVLDPTCGSGTTAAVSEQWGRRWITCDTSRVAITLAKQRLMTSIFDFYQLARPDEGVASGFVYKTVPHITLKSIANNEPPAQETLYDQPLVDNLRVRVCGPFTVEAVPAPIVQPLTDLESQATLPDKSITRSGETLRQTEWRDELFKTGIRGKGGQKITFSRIETFPAGPKIRYIHAVGETKEDEPKPIAVSFGPEHAPLEQRQVAIALEEGMKLVPKPKLLIFAAFQFDPEASKDIDETDWPGVTILKLQMAPDLLTTDLKKKRVNNESFWLIGQPDVIIEKISDGSDKGKFKVSLKGYDYYNTRNGMIESGGPNNIALWMLDPDYDGRSLFPRQVFFPMAGEKDGWGRLAKNLKAEIDEERIEAFRGIISLPFETGSYHRVAVKIVDDRGIESLKIVELD